MSIKAPKRGYLFDSVEFNSPDKSAFDLSHRKCLTAQFDYLYPIMNHHCLPGETYELNLNSFFRTSPLVCPVMQDIDVKFYFFWVPYRVIFRKWRRFISNGDGTISVDSSLAGQKYCDLPFVTDSDLVARGNFSYTSEFRGFHTETGDTIKANRIPQEISPLVYDDGSNPAVINFSDGCAPGSLADYLGIAQYSNTSQLMRNNSYYQRLWSSQNSLAWDTVRRDNDNRTFTSFDFRAYNKIWYDYFRDENYMTDVNNSVPIRYQYFTASDSSIKQSSTSNKLKIWDEDADYYGFNGESWDRFLNVGLLKKCWQRDYITSALPSPQRGGDVLLPLGDSAPLVFDPSHIATDPTKVHTAKIDGADVVGNLRLANGNLIQLDASSLSGQAAIDVTGNTTVDLTAATSATLNSLRVANAMQKFLEKFARTGSRYVEAMQAHFDVIVPDAASDRCSLISTARVPLQINTNSSESAVQLGDSVLPQGTQTANAQGSGGVRFKFSTDEHGIIMGLMCIEPNISYGSSMSRDWLRRDPLDFAWPSFGHLGEQPVWASEVYPVVGNSTESELADYDSTFSRTDVKQTTTFGYQSRYCEYKYKQNSVHGRFKDDMNYYTLSRFLNTRHGSNSALTQNIDQLICNVEDYQNIFTEVASSTNGNCADHFYFDMYFDFKAIRPLPQYGTPSL